MNCPRENQTPHGGLRAGGPAALLVLVALAAGLAVLPTRGATMTDVDVQPANQTVAAGETTTVTVVLDDADGGVGRYDLNLSVANASVAEIVDIDYELGPRPAAFGTFNVTLPNVTRDGTSADKVLIRQIGVESADTGSVALVTVTVRGQQAGTTDAELVVEGSTGDDDGDPVTFDPDEEGPLVPGWNGTVEGSAGIRAGDIVATPDGGYLFSDTVGGPEQRDDRGGSSRRGRQPEAGECAGLARRSDDPLRGCLPRRRDVRRGRAGGVHRHDCRDGDHRGRRRARRQEVRRRRLTALVVDPDDREDQAHL